MVIIIVSVATVIVWIIFGVFCAIAKELDDQVKILNDYTARLFNHTVELAKIISEQKKKIDSLEDKIKFMESGSLSEYDF